MLRPVIEAHGALAGACQQTNSTAELSVNIDALQFLMSLGPVPRDTHVCIAFDYVRLCGFSEHPLL